MFRSGQVVAGRYEIVALIGERSLAAVFRARDRTTAREIALKAVRPGFITRVGAQAMQREAQLAASIGQNASIVEAIDIGYDDALGTPYIVMPLLTGETLQQRIARSGALPPEELQKYVQQLGFALDKAHQIGVVHAALAPSKLFLTRDQRQDPIVKILDFGVAKVLDNHPEAASVLAHAAYTAPEQLSPQAKQVARSYGARIADGIAPPTDVWAVGLIAFEALLGAPPGTFWGVRQAQEVAMKIVQRPPVPSQVAGAKASQLPQGFDEWFKRCVHLDPAKRFPRASEATNELVTLLDQLVPKPSTALGGAVPTFLVGASDTTADPMPRLSHEPAQRLSHEPAQRFSREPSVGAQPAPPPPAPAPPQPIVPPRPPPRALETALAIPDHEISRLPPAPRVPDAPAPPRSNALAIAVVVGLVVVAIVVGVVVVLVKK
jgi:serine/threonine-protein kinase